MNAPLPASAHRLLRALADDQVEAAAAWLDDHPGFLGGADTAIAPNGSPWLLLARSTSLADLLLAQGAQLGHLSRWWAPGFGLSKVEPAVAEHLVARGATLSPHAAAALGLESRLRELLDRHPAAVHAPGGDGGQPLHFARDLPVARLLVERGAALDPLDDDHRSTPAQWRIDEAPEVTRFLVTRGARPDIFMAARFGDRDLAERLIRETPDCVTWRIGDDRGPFPGIGYQGRGGTIYQWTLGFNLAPHEVARRHRHDGIFDLLWEHTPPRTRLLVACTQADRAAARALQAAEPGLVAGLAAGDRALLAKMCWETNLNLEAVRLMLELGFPVDCPESNHGHSPLHNAAFSGSPELVELLLRHGHPVNVRDPVHHATPLGWAIHSCTRARRHPGADFPRIVDLLLAAGAVVEPGTYPTGDDGIDAVLGRLRRPGGPMST